MLLAWFFSKRRFFVPPIEKVLSTSPVKYPITNLLLLLSAGFAGGPDIIANGLKTAVFLTGLSHRRLRIPNCGGLNLKLCYSFMHNSEVR
jgi:hypothetical protein